MDLCSAAFASPYPQTPTPGGSATANQLNRPPLTSLKPFGYAGTLKPLVRKPHPLTQVSMIDSRSTIANDTTSINRRANPSHHNITLSKQPNEADQSLEDDLLAFEQEQRNLRPSLPRTSRVSDDLTEDESYMYSNEDQSTQTTTNDDEQESDFDQDSDSFRIGLSSLSPPGIGRSAPQNGHLSNVTLDPDDGDFPYQAGEEFSRDLSALSLSPIRRPSNPTPQRSNTIGHDQGLTIDDNRSQISQTQVSGFQGVARQLKHDFEQYATVPSPDRSKKKKVAATRRPTRGGTLKGGLPANDGLRAKRVFGAELAQGLKHPRLHQLHSAGLTSTPPAKSQTPHLPQQDHNQQSGKNALADLKHYPPSRPASTQMHKPTIRIVDATYDTANHPAGLNASMAPQARKIVENSVRVPDVTGLTEALRSPQVADFRSGNMPEASRPSIHNARPDPTLSEALSLLRNRLTSLETENVACQTRIRDLQSQLNHSNEPSAPRGPVRHGLSINDQPDRPAKSTNQLTTERMLQKLTAHTRRLTDSIEAHAIVLDELTGFKIRHKNVRQELRGVKSEVRQWSDEVDDMKDSLEGLTKEVREIRNMIEKLMNSTSQSVPANNNQLQGPSQPAMSRQVPKISKISDFKAPLSKSQQEIKRNSRNTTIQPPAQPDNTRNSESRQPAQSQKTRHDIEDWRSQASTVPNSGRSFIGPDEIKRLKKEVAEEQAMKSSNKAIPKVSSSRSNLNPSSSVPPPPLVTTQPTSSRVAPIRTSSAPSMNFTGSTAPFKATDELLRGEAIINSLPKGKHDDTSCSQCRLRRQKTKANVLSSRTSSAPVAALPAKNINVQDNIEDEESKVPPQMVLVKLLRDLEEDFEAHRKIFIELSETYRKMNPASTQANKRKALAQHLRESVDTLEKKAGHIKDLYNLLHVKDVASKPGA